MDLGHLLKLLRELITRLNDKNRLFFEMLGSLKNGKIESEKRRVIDLPRLNCTSDLYSPVISSLLPKGKIDKFFETRRIYSRITRVYLLNFLDEISFRQFPCQNG